MAKAKNSEDTLATELVLALLETLESQRRIGGDAYPTSLRRLAELCDGTHPEERIVKAAGKKAFTDRASAEKQNGKPKLDGVVRFKEDLPAKPSKPKAKAPAKEKAPGPDLAKLAERALSVLDSQRRLGRSAYPPPLRRLIELCELNASDGRVPGVVGHPAFADRVVVGGMNGRKPHLDAPAFLKEDLSDALPALLSFSLGLLRTGAGRTFSKKQLAAKLAPSLRPLVESALSKGKVEQQTLPDDLAWVPATKGEPLYFHLDDIQPASQRGRPRQAPPIALHSPSTNGAAPPPARDFARAFQQAFDDADRRNRATNFVKLSDLRRALPEFGRSEFDAGLRLLRSDGLFTLNSHEGLHGSLTQEDREAGVQEAGSHYIYASRR